MIAVRNEPHGCLGEPEVDRSQVIAHLAGPVAAVFDIPQAELAVRVMAPASDARLRVAAWGAPDSSAKSIKSASSSRPTRPSTEWPFQ